MAWERRGTRFIRAAPSAKIISYRPQQCVRLCLLRVNLVGYSDGGEVALLMAALSPGLVRSVLTGGAAGAVSDPEGRIVSALSGLWDNPVAGFQDYRDHFATIYGEPVGRATTQSFADASEAIAAAGGDISRGRSLSERQLRPHS